jgi:hypothetical protein
LDACRESNSLQSAQRSAAQHERSVKIGCRSMMSIRVIIRSCACSTIPLPARQVVDGHDPVAAFEPQTHGKGTDVTGAAGDEDG